MATGAKLFVGCLPYSKTEADLQPLFEQFGPLSEVAVLKKPDGTSKGAAFVSFQSADSASAAAQYLSGYCFPGSNRGINISLAGGGQSFGGGQSVGGGGGKGFGGASGQGFGGGFSGPAGKGKGKGKAPQMQSFQQQQQMHFPQFGWQPAPPAGNPFSMGMNAGHTAPGTKLFIGQLPYSRNENDLWQLFGSIGPVAEVVMLKDKNTNEKKGAAFVKYHNAQNAMAAVGALDGFMFSGSTRAISVSPSQSDGPQQGQKRKADFNMIKSMGMQAPGALNVGGGAAVGTNPSAPHVEGAKLFVGQLPFSRGEAEIANVFSKYGSVAEVFLHRDQQGKKKGGAFVRFCTADSAMSALEMDGFFFDGATRPITVALAADGGAKRQRME